MKQLGRKRRVAWSVGTALFLLVIVVGGAFWDASAWPEASAGAVVHTFDQLSRGLAVEDQRWSPAKRRAIAARVGALKAEIEQERRVLDALAADLALQERQISTAQAQLSALAPTSSGQLAGASALPDYREQVAKYNQLVQNYNQTVGDFNAEQLALHSLIDEYNVLISQP